MCIRDRFDSLHSFSVRGVNCYKTKPPGNVWLTFCIVSGSIQTEELREPFVDILVFEEPDEGHCNDDDGGQEGATVEGDHVLGLEHANQHLDMTPQRL